MADFVYLPRQDAYRCPAGETMKWWINRVDENGMTLRHYWTTRCPECPIKAQCTPAKMRRVTRWEHEGVLDAMQKRLDHVPQAMILRRQTVEHPFGTIKAWMGSIHFLTRTPGSEVGHPGRRASRRRSRGPPARRVLSG